MRTEFVPSLVLHTRNFTDSRLLVELFSAEHGRVSAVARSAKKGGRFALLRPFQPLLVSWQGRSELKTLTQVEAAGGSFPIVGDYLYCGMYLNELVLRVLPQIDPHPSLYESYQSALLSLARQQPVEPLLRNFELDLLTALGYGIPFDVDAASGEPISPDKTYIFDAEAGFVGGLASSRTDHRQVLFSGEVIAHMATRNFADNNVLNAAKQLCRLALHPLLGDKPLKSRELFRKN